MDFCLGIQALAVEFELSVTSWFRSATRNISVGGKDVSWHLAGLAVDIVLDKFEDKENFKARAERLGFQVINEGDHYHLEPNI